MSYTAARAAAQRRPAKLRVRRASVSGGHLELRVELTRGATGSLEGTYFAAGRRTTFQTRIPEASTDGEDPNVFRIRQRIPASQRARDTGIVTLRYPGDEDVRPGDVRVRAASNPAELRRSDARIDRDGNLVAAGTISRRARGVVRVRLDYPKPSGELATERYRARIQRSPGSAAGRWSLTREAPASAVLRGGFLSIQFTGHLPRRVGGEQTTKELAPPLRPGARP